VFFCPSKTPEKQKGRAKGKKKEEKSGKAVRAKD
jgi:hypothetical protein